MFTTAASIAPVPEAVRIITSGDEIVAPGKPLCRGQIYDSVGTALRTWCESLGISDCRNRHLPDNRLRLRAAFAKALEEADLVLSVPSIGFVRVAKGQAVIQGQSQGSGQRMGKAKRTGVEVEDFAGRAFNGIPILADLVGITPLRRVLYPLLSQIR